MKLMYLVCACACVAQLLCTVVCAGGTVRGTPTTQFGNLTLVSSGYSWVENIFFDHRGAMYFSESVRGEIYRVTQTASGDFVTQLWLSGFKRCLGFSLTQSGAEMFAVAWTGSSTYNIIVFSIDVPNQFRVIATTPTSGNGLGLDRATNVLYTTTEGEFLPDAGKIFAMQVSGVAVNTSSNATVRIFAEALEAADGLWIDEDTRVMYMSEVLNATVRLYNLSRASEGADAAFMYAYKAPGMTMLDDMSVTSAYCTSNTTMLFAADFWAGNIVATPADGSGAATVLVEGLFSPTSVRPGVGVWRPEGARTLYITEGGGVFSWETSRRVWQLTLNDAFSC